MEEPQQQDAEASFQGMDPDLSSVMEWEMLLEITRHMATADRSNWRLVNKAALQAVYDSTEALAPSNVRYDTPTALRNTATALLPQILKKCGGLKKLSCAYLPLHTISGLLQLPPRLEDLDITRADVVDLSFIARCSSLKRLKLAAEPGFAGPRSRQLAAALEQLPGLKALELRLNSLGVDGAHDVSAALRNLTGLEELDISGTGLEAAAAALLLAVPHLKGLRLLDLSNCLLDGQALLPAVMQLTRLQQLHLCNNSLQADGALILAPALGKLTQLERLGLFGNKLCDEGIAALAPAIQQLTGLTSLGLGENQFGLAGAQALAPALRPLTRLRSLDLSCNNVGPEGAALLALTGLRCLDLRNVGLDAGGMAALAPALQRLTLLQHLDLSCNALGPEGLQALLLGIKQLVSLRSLNLHFLGYTGLNREGTLLFAAGIQQLSRLEELDLAANALGVELEQALAHVIHTASPGCKVSCA